MEEKRIEERREGVRRDSHPNRSSGSALNHSIIVKAVVWNLQTSHYLWRVWPTPMVSVEFNFEGATYTLRDRSHEPLKFNSSVSSLCPHTDGVWRPWMTALRFPIHFTNASQFCPETAAAPHPLSQPGRQGEETRPPFPVPCLNPSALPPAASSTSSLHHQMPGH